MNAPIKAAGFALACLPVEAAALCNATSILDLIPSELVTDLRAEASAVENGEGLQWIATRGEDTLHILGSIHIYDPRLGPILNGFEDELAASDILIVEMTLKDQKQLETTLMADPSLLLLPDNKTMFSYVDEGTWARIGESLEARDLPPAAVARFQPWYISLVLATPACAMAEAAQGLAGLDNLILTKAAEMGLPTQSIEAWETTIDLFIDESIDTQIEIMKMISVGADLEDEAFTATLDAYFSGDTGLLIEMPYTLIDVTPGLDAERAKQLYADFEDELLDERNLAWIPVIERAAEDHDTISIVVGAAHLPGELGVVELLRAEGWTLTPAQ